MQTFLPYRDFRMSLMCLDPKRLGNQVYRECLTLVRGNWINHPASKMWRGYEYSLCEYGLAGLYVLATRGKIYLHHVKEFLNLREQFPNTGNPSWLGDDDFHASHRSNLLRKNLEWYSQFGWSEPDNLPYVWPTV